MTARRETDLSWKLGLRGYAVFPTHLHDIRGSQHTPKASLPHNFSCTTHMAVTEQS